MPKSRIIALSGVYFCFAQMPSEKITLIVFRTFSMSSPLVFSVLNTPRAVLLLLLYNLHRTHYKAKKTKPHLRPASQTIVRLRAFLVRNHAVSGTRLGRRVLKRCPFHLSYRVYVYLHK